VLALAEMGRYPAALRAIDDFVAAYGEENHADLLRRFLAWWRGQPPDLPSTQPESSQDLHRYWALEAQFANGSDLRTLMPQLERTLILSSETVPMLLALKAELLAGSGDADDAAETSVQSYELALQQRRELTGVCAHFELIARRAARFTRAAGNESRAAEIETELAQWLGTRG
jgi:hypothetical protein